MINHLKCFLTLFGLIIMLCSCEKNCNCELVVYESTFETSYEWVERSRESTKACERDPMSSTFLDDNNNISYVRTVLECNN